MTAEKPFYLTMKSYKYVKLTVSRKVLDTITMKESTVDNGYNVDGYNDKRL